MLWALHPEDPHTHAILPDDLSRSPALGYAEALCGTQVPDAGLKTADRPWGVLCLPCAIGATADLPDPGRTGTDM
jgi:hypothetical protein